MAADDRLSDLPDDLLCRILHFVPVREAASTSLLSRRWGSLWRSSGAVNLVEHVNNDETPETAELFCSRRHGAFLRAADAALASSCGHVTRLAVDVEVPNGCWIGKFLNGDETAGNTDVLDAVVSHPALRRLEELHLRVVASDHSVYGSLMEEEVRWNIGIYSLSLASLTFETLRALDITGCNMLDLPAACAFPRRLETLTLRHGDVELTRLQRVIDASPGLTTLHFESVFFITDNNSDDHYHGEVVDAGQACVHLRCPAATSLVLELDRSGGIGIDSPKLCSFRYKGLPRPLYLKSPAPDMTVVSLHFIHQMEEDTTRVNFWRFTHNFTDVKILKLVVHNLVHLAVAGKASRAELLRAFPNLERLLLEALEMPTVKKSAVAIANLLRCCPVLRDLTLKLIRTRWTASDWSNPYDKSRFQPDFDNSIDHFKRRTSNASLNNENSDRHGDEVSDIPALSRRRSFTCLQSSLRKVNLKFELSTLDCFGVQLVKFFAQNAMVLEEMCIDSGNRKLHDHMNLNVERWVGADSTKISLKRKNFAESSWEFSRVLPGSTTRFTVLPLER
ncbi:hypothetical protein E2562_028134 [Oryza meyeriana var. granulata]|uniref:F-box domain-containing protein n=1 Tax=Oryza meyeriana var. granulata TaxID=110450 RepID=A0A6G1C8M7_9ORYZ|nr:hypothetical protein E2562_028134 [Oryza meyeriana var. granulata]